MKQPTAGLVPLIAIFTGFIAAACIATGAYWGAALAVDIGLFMWFCLKFGLSGKDHLSNEGAFNFLGMLITLFPLFVFSLFDLAFQISNGQGAAPRSVAALSFLSILAYKALPQAKEATRVLLPKGKEGL